MPSFRFNSLTIMPVLEIRNHQGLWIILNSGSYVEGIPFNDSSFHWQLDYRSAVRVCLSTSKLFSSH